jgi:hypothetical protein
MNPRLRHAMLLLGLCACAGCRHLSGIQPVQPAQFFNREAESKPAEEVPAKPVGPIRSSSEETSSRPPSLFADPGVDEPSDEHWPVDSIADTYERPSCNERLRAECGDMLHCIRRDYRNYYSLENFGMLAAGFGVGAILANTDLDENIHHWHKDYMRSHSTDEFGHVVKYFGEGGYEATLFAAAWMMGNMYDDTRTGAVVSEWGSRGLRTIVVGAPPMLLMQFITGASRPEETSAESSWKPFSDANGVSGHAFMGAVPFVSAAKMTENLPLKLGFYACSTFPAWSRVNDGAHYTSQSFLGWWMAYCAATAVDMTERNGHDWTIMPLPMTDGAGMAVTYQY